MAIVATITVLAPTAGAAGGEQGAARAGSAVMSVSVAASPSTVFIGSPLHVNGAVGHVVTQQRVVLQRLVGHRWATLLTTLTTKQGGYTFTLRAPSKTASWAVRVRAAGATSRVALVHVVADRFTVRIKLGSNAVAPGKAVLLSGTISPASAGAVHLQVLRGAQWVNTASARLHGSHFSVRTIRLPGDYRLRVVSDFTSRRSAGVSNSVRARVTSPPTTAKSRGGSVTVGMSGVLVTASAGAIRAGQTIRIHRLPAVSGPALRSAGGGPLQLTTSQGQPTGHVTISFAVTPKVVASAALVVHQFTVGGDWLPEPTTISPDGGTATAVLDHFSLLDLVDRFDYSWGVLTGNRADIDPLSDCGPAPSWVEPVVLPTPADDLNTALWACPTTKSDQATLYLHVVNNRGYVQVLNVTGATVDVARSVLGDSLEQTVSKAVSALQTAAGPAGQVFLAGGENVTLAIPRPSGRRDATVDISAAPNGDSVVVGLEWAVIKKVSARTADVTQVANCILDVTSSKVSVDDAFTTFKDCSTKLDPYSVAGVVGAAVDTIIAVDGEAQKLLDTHFQDKYPSNLVVGLRGNGASTPPPTTPLPNPPTPPAAPTTPPPASCESGGSAPADGSVLAATTNEYVGSVITRPCGGTVLSDVSGSVVRSRSGQTLWSTEPGGPGDTGPIEGTGPSFGWDNDVLGPGDLYYRTTTEETNHVQQITQYQGGQRTWSVTAPTAIEVKPAGSSGLIDLVTSPTPAPFGGAAFEERSAATGTVLATSPEAVIPTSASEPDDTQWLAAYPGGAVALYDGQLLFWTPGNPVAAVTLPYALLPAFSTPVVGAGGAVFLGSCKGTFAEVTASGIAWSTSLTGESDCFDAAAWGLGPQLAALPAGGVAVTWGSTLTVLNQAGGVAWSAQKPRVGTGDQAPRLWPTGPIADTAGNIAATWSEPEEGPAVPDSTLTPEASVFSSDGQEAWERSMPSADTTATVEFAGINDIDSGEVYVTSSDNVPGSTEEGTPPASRMQAFQAPVGAPWPRSTLW